MEKKQQVKELRRLGCQRAQGFFYSRPLTDVQFRAVLEAGGILPQEEPDHREPSDQPRLFQTA